MSDKRKTDETIKTRFRTQRFAQHDGKWYFLTREGSTEGPFDSKWDAEQMLEKYLGIEASGMLSEGLSIMPKEN